MFFTKGDILYKNKNNNKLFNIPIKPWMLTYSLKYHSNHFNDFNSKFLHNMIQIDNCFYKIIKTKFNFTYIVLYYYFNNYYKIFFYKIKELDINQFININFIFKNIDISSIIYNLYTEIYIDKIIIANEYINNSWDTQIYYFNNNILSFISNRNNLYNNYDYEEVYTDGNYITNYLYSDKIRNIPKRYTYKKKIPKLNKILDFL